jgi:hypothetical protein
VTIVQRSLQAQGYAFASAVNAAYAAANKLLRSGLIDDVEGDDLERRIGSIESEVFTILSASHADDAAINAAIAAIREQQAKVESITNRIQSRLEGRASPAFWWGVGAVALGLGAVFVWLNLSKRRKAV